MLTNSSHRRKRIGPVFLAICGIPIFLFPSRTVSPSYMPRPPNSTSATADFTTSGLEVDSPRALDARIQFRGTERQVFPRSEKWFRPLIQPFPEQCPKLDRASHE